MHIQLDAMGGIAGDMFIAAVLDAWPEHEEGVLQVIRATGIPSGWTFSLVDHRDDVLSGRRFAVLEPSGHASHAHGGHRSFLDIRRQLLTADLEPEVLQRGLHIFELLARAEAEVHGVDVDDVIFHEVGAWDSVADIMGVAYLINVLQLSSWSLGPLPVGGGRILTAHGAMPVPAPATAKLLQDFVVFDDGIDGERVTPTGAAILAYLRQQLGVPARSMPQPMTLARSGTGFGVRTLPGMSNVLRVLCFAEVSPGRVDNHVVVISFEIDDQTPEDLAVGINALRELDGVLEVVQIPAIGKKNRMVSQIQLICRREILHRAMEACFIETTTLGLRWTMMERATLDRTMVDVDVDGQRAGVKIAARPDGGRSAKCEIDHSGAGGHQARQGRRATAEDHALRAQAPEKA